MRDDVDKNDKRDESPGEQMVVHYYLLDDKHSMDAFIRNKAEAEMLALVRHLLLQLNLDVQVESTARKEGGLVDILTFALRPEVIALSALSVTALLGIINIIISLMNAKDRKGEKLTRALTVLSIEEKTLAIEEKKLNLQKLRAELMREKPDQAEIERLTPALGYDVKTITLRSNFFRLLVTYPQVTAVGFGPKPRRGTMAERIVPRPDFSTYVLTSDKLPTEIHREASIEIVAPVIGKGQFHWRGIWHGEIITFQMRDQAFRGMVERGEIGFRRGDSIKCDINIERKVDALGDEVVMGHAVTTVISKVEGGTKEVETAKGRRLRYDREVAEKTQGTLFAPESTDDLK